MPEILRQNGYVVCIYCELGGQHHLPHCHVKWDDKEAVVALPTLMLIVGDKIPAAGVAILIENIDLLVAQWERLNPSEERTTKDHRTMATKRVEK